MPHKDWHGVSCVLLALPPPFPPQTPNVNRALSPAANALPSPPSPLAAAEDILPLGAADEAVTDVTALDAVAAPRPQ